MKATVSASALRRQLNNAALFASTDSTRPILSSVRFELSTDGVQLVATDSYALVRARLGADAVDQPGSFMLALGDVKTLLSSLKSLPKYGTPTVDLIAEDGNVRVVVAGTTHTFRDTHELGEFPNYAQILESYKPGEIGSVAFTSAALTRFGKLDDGTARKAGSVVRLEHGETNLKPSMFYAGTDIDGLVMPTRTA